ncbi:hypothetical protein [Corallococcus aberystwythensis]|uniref:Lipoprotein n=1 Tax=Corallococcus aberystwythensis TaxID=2316722 RepID=A0A3A8QP13_9BACT|nr:hypothetical protein [Corallococcus aberystwythensis]RKH70519.1 hypothetical protein D7W81_09160 [Corallococcus aberystwythensis]
MNRLLALVVPLALLMGTGCVVEAHSHRPVRRVAYVAPVAEYRFAGAHPVPDDYGGGWCPEDYAHVHDYQPPQASYVYTDNVYYYRGPTVVWYWDYHPISSGGYCNLHGRHQHDYYPRGSWGSGYSYDRGGRGYRWDNTHAASAGSGRNNVAPSRPAPAPVNQGRNPPPGGNGTGARPPSGSGGWGRSNAAPAANSSRNDDNDNNKGNGWNTPASKSRDDDNDSNRGNSGSSSGGGRSSGSGWGSPGGSSSGSSGSSGGGSGRGSSGSSSGNSGSGGWNTGKGSGSSSGSGKGGTRW